MKVVKDNVVEIFQGKIDKKNKLNRADKLVPSDLLEQIENGLTIETIQKLTKELNLPLFSYYTQITIHGLFPDFDSFSTFGYKNVFQNKNKSIGVKWSAIDESKRKSIYKYLRFTDFYYSRNSTEHSFRITKRVKDETEFKTKLADLKAISDKIDTTLFYGMKQIFAGSYMGMKYLVLEFVVNAIYETNIPILLSKMGYSEDWYKNELRLKVEAENEREAKYQAAEQKDNDLKEAELLKHKTDIDYIKTNFEYIQTNDTGLYIHWEHKSYNEFAIKFIVTNIYKEGRKKYPRIANRSFDTLKEALLCTEIEPKFSDRPLRYKYKAYRITTPEIKEPKKVIKETKTTQKSNVTVIDYSDKAVAIFGDTKPIKEQLKKIGCRFNAYLTYEGIKQAGWIAPMNKKDKLLQLI